MRWFLAALSLLMAGGAQAQAWQEPARGSENRRALMDAIRPQVIWILGAPVEFVVYDLRQYGDLAFANLAPQRPGGGFIDPYATPAFRRGELIPDEMDGTGLQVLYQRSGGAWVAVHWVMGAGDVWYAESQICAVWRPVIPEACQGL